MSRAYAIYSLMFAMMIAGLWVILTLGAAVNAPDDLNGEWTVTWQGPPPAEVKNLPMRVSQSGEFFVVSFGNQPPISFTLQPGWKGSGNGRRLKMRLDGNVWKMKLTGDIPLGQAAKVWLMQIELTGPGEHVGSARRVGVEPSTRPAGVAHAR